MHIGYIVEWMNINKFVSSTFIFFSYGLVYYLKRVIYTHFSVDDCLVFIRTWRLLLYYSKGYCQIDNSQKNIHDLTTFSFVCTHLE